MKTCFKCNKEKPLSDFYKHKQMATHNQNKHPVSVCSKFVKLWIVVYLVISIGILISIGYSVYVF